MVREHGFLTRLSRCVRFLVVAGLVVSLASCGRGDRKAIYPVHGKVLFQGKAAEGAQVTLVPLDDDANMPRPGAQVKRNGSFRLSTYASYDDAPAGSYAVTIVYRSPEKKVDGENAGPDLLRGMYGDARTTPLRIEIKEGPNELEPFNLE